MDFLRIIKETYLNPVAVQLLDLMDMLPTAGQNFQHHHFSSMTLKPNNIQGESEKTEFFDF